MSKRFTCKAWAPPWGSLRTRVSGLLIVGCLQWSGLASATVPVQAPDPDAALERVHAGKDAAYREVVAEFDAAMREAPDDPALAVSKCRFIGQFTDEDYDPVEAAPAEFEACQKSLETRWPHDPEVELFGLDQAWGKDAITRGEALLRKADAWSPALRRRLVTMVSEAHENEDGASVRGGELAVQAVQLGETSRVASAVTYLVDSGKLAQAKALLRRTPPATAAWQAARRIKAAMALPDRSAAFAELVRYKDAGFKVDAITAAKAQLRAGHVAAARKLLDTPASTPAFKEARFDAALAAGDTKAAAAQISLDDSTQFAMAVQRAALVAHASPAALLSSQVLVTLLVMLLMLALMSLAPGLVLLPVHYRGMVRRVRGKIATPLFEGINLRHAWLGAAVAISVPMLVALVVAPGSIASLLGGDHLPGQQGLLDLAVWGSIAGLLVLFASMRKLGWRQLFGDRSAWRSWWRVMLAWAIVISVSMALTALHRNGGDTSTEQTRMVDSMIGGGFQRYGLAMTLLIMAVLVPIYEELVFRGLLLGGMTSHIGFGWANLIQAVLFALVHGDNPRFLFYLTLGLLSGWLAKKSRSLGPGMALHGANNALATLIRFAGAG
jgi:membrane protease YdiL (CAAX protease family)